MFSNFGIFAMNSYRTVYFNVIFSHCSTGIYQAFDGQTAFLRVFEFAILCTINSPKNWMRKTRFTVFETDCEWLFV